MDKTYSNGKSEVSEPLSPVFKDGTAQPVFDFDSVIREIVYVETDVDSDGDGFADKVQVLIQRPAATEKGMKAAVLFEARPYSAGMSRDFTFTDYHSRIEDVVLKEAKETTTTTKDDWKWVPSPPSPEMKRQAVNGEGTPAYDEDVFTRTANVNSYDYWLIRGYVFASCAGLGTRDSDGFETCASSLETSAFASVARWLSGDPSVKAFTDRTSGLQVKPFWSNGNVCMTGKSYAGSIPYAVASTGAPVKTIVPVAGIASWYDYYRSQGTYKSCLFNPGEDTDTLADGCQSRKLNEEEYVPFKEKYRETLLEMRAQFDQLGGDYNTFWDERNYMEGKGQRQCSALIIHGLNDFNVMTVNAENMFRTFRNDGLETRIILHQGAHCVIDQLENLDYHGILGRWFAHYLYGIDNGAEKEAPVLIQDNRDLSWHEYDDLSSNGCITFQAESGTKTFVSDPSKAGYNVSFKDKMEGPMYLGDEVYEWEEAIKSGSTEASVVYTFDVNEDMHISGSPVVTVKASSDTPTGILSGMLVDIAPDGMEAVLREKHTEQIPVHVVTLAGLVQGGALPDKDTTQFTKTRTKDKIVTRGWMDIQNRTSIYNTDVVKPGEFYEFQLKMQPEDYTVAAGHKLALVLYSVDVEITLRPALTTTFTVDGAGTSVTIPVLK
ncbi:MAG: hypothetical protein K5629_04055 [Eubacteriales bacterium]|nr:hypothetical protein [Eubacteriales bacterium]